MLQIIILDLFAFSYFAVKLLFFALLFISTSSAQDAKRYIKIETKLVKLVIKLLQNW